MSQTAVSKKEIVLAHGVDAKDESSAIPIELAAASPTPTSTNSDDQTSLYFLPIMSNETLATTDTPPRCLYFCCSEINKKPSAENFML